MAGDDFQFKAPPRKRFSGDTSAAAHYVGPATKLLGFVKEQMAYNNLQQWSRQITLAGGVVLSASSVYGQDEIRVHVPTGRHDGEAPVRVRARKTAKSVFAAGTLIQTQACFFWRDGDENITPVPPVASGFHNVAGVSTAGDVCGTGHSFIPGDPSVPFRWSQRDGIELLDAGPSGFATATCMSAGGSVVAGWYVPYNGASSATVLWKKGGGREVLLGGADNVPAAMSADASFMAGTGGTTTSIQDVWTWSEAHGFDVIATLPPALNTNFYSVMVSADGSTVAWGQAENGVYSAYRWTKKEGAQLISLRPGVVVVGVSATGAAVYLTDEAGAALTRWTAADGLVPVEAQTGIGYTRSAAACLAGETPTLRFDGDSIVLDGDLEVFAGFTFLQADHNESPVLWCSDGRSFALPQAEGDFYFVAIGVEITDI